MEHVEQRVGGTDTEQIPEKNENNISLRSQFDCKERKDSATPIMIPLEEPIVYTVHVLFDGFSKINKSRNVMQANCTCTLIKGPTNIIVDTMTAWDGPKIIKALEQHQLTPDLINWVVCTHGHSDHIGNNALFQNATHIVGTSVSKRETYYLDAFVMSPKVKIDDYVEIIQTPGHTLTDVSVIVRVGKTVVAIVGDLFEREEDLENEIIWLEAGSECPEKQRENRDHILQIADFIIPGHGPMFIVNKNKL